ncbi:hypothetical protein [Agrobacterium larrymoorei]|uniref:Uncharacterized protein n=1 Tax=Agrobacterium larrymoorei TaxID=160699 RepID=A0A4D7DSW2_9HYPH|nr:hypothetical protein [Agrobacterium larrymoorei]QCI99558.1 hypothetical protein CFBP5473_16310 [Agrobacterium larrymoorei]QYA09106.1 hypothetical protein J5285_17040 [Agrobacterium larrymoorei]
MPTGFNLFSFDAFSVFKNKKHEIDFASSGPLPKPAEYDEEGTERDREREADIAFWGLAYYPVM